MNNLSFPKYGSLYWGKSNSKGSAVEVSRNELVVVAEGYMVEPGSFLPNPESLAVSTNARSVWQKPSPYYPSQAAFLKLCQENDWLLKWDNGDIAVGWPGTYMFDVSNNDCVDTLVPHILGSIFKRPEFEGCTTLFMDEMHAHIIGVVEPHPGKLAMYNGTDSRVILGSNSEYSLAWERGTRRLLKRFNALAPHIKIMPNGTYVTGHPAIGGHYWQSSSSMVNNNVNQVAMFNRIWESDVMNYDTKGKNIIIHAIAELPSGRWRDFEKFCLYNACFAALLDAHSHVDDNRFLWSLNYQAIPAGSFGMPVEYRSGVSDVPVIQEPLAGLKIREFDSAIIKVNLNDVSVVYEGKVYDPRSARVVWK